MKKSIIAALLLGTLITAVSLTGCSSDTSSKATKVTPTSSETLSSAAAKDETFKVGDTIKVNGAELTVKKVAKSQGSEYDEPKSGNEFVIVSVSIKNIGTNQLAYNPYYFKMKNSQGQITEETITSVNQDTQLQSGELASGGSVSGDVIFEEPKGDKGLVLQYLSPLDEVLANIKLI
jgi:hypothetical protein